MLGPYNVLNKNKWDNVPRDPVTAAITASLTSILGGSAAAGLLASGIVFLASTAIVGAITSALTPSQGSGASGLVTNVKEAAHPSQLVYGQIRKGGVITYLESTGATNQFLHMFIVLAGHEVEEIGDIYVNDEVVEITQDNTYNYTLDVEIEYQSSPPADDGPFNKFFKATLEVPKTEPNNFDEGEILTSTQVINYYNAGQLKIVRQDRIENWVEPNINNTNRAQILTKKDDDGFVGGKWQNKIRIIKALGDQTTVNPKFFAETENPFVLYPNGNDANTAYTAGNCPFVMKKLAYLYVRLEFDQDVFTNGVPLFTALVKGKKVYDPRTDTTVWSDNPALCIRDYLTESYGLNTLESSIDDTSFTVAANDCDADVALAGGGTTDRYDLNGVVNLDSTIKTNLEQMLTSCGGSLFYVQGKFNMRAGVYTAPVRNFGYDNLRSEIAIRTKTPRRDSFNSVSGTFQDKDEDYIEADYPPIKSPTFVANDGGYENPLDLPLPYTVDSAMAQRLAKLTLFRSREEIVVSADFDMTAFEVQVGDTVTLTLDRYGWTDKEFEVADWIFENNPDNGDPRITMSLKETSLESYAWDAEEIAITSNNSTLTPATAGLTIDNLLLTLSTVLQKDGTTVPVVEVDWDNATSQLLDFYEVQWAKTADMKFSAATTKQSQYVVQPLITNTEYVFRVRSVTQRGNKGGWSSQTITVGEDVTPPALPTVISAVGGFQYITISWTNPIDTDFSFVEVYENTSNTTVGATKIGTSSGDTFTRTNLGLEVTRYYFLKSVDYTGNKSAFTAGVSATTTYLDDPDFENGIRSLFEEQGLFPIEDVTSLPPSGSIVGEKVFNRSDGKLYEWNGSAWTLMIAAVDAPDIIGKFVAADKIVANTITGGLLQTSGIITNTAQIGNGLITNAKISDLSADKINTGELNADFIKIDNTTLDTDAQGNLTISTGGVSTPFIANNAVTETAFAQNLQSINVTSTTWVNLISLSFSDRGSTTSTPIKLDLWFQMEGDFANLDASRVNVRFLRNSNALGTSTPYNSGYGGSRVSHSAVKLDTTGNIANVTYLVQAQLFSATPRYPANAIIYNPQLNAFQRLK